MLSIINNSGSIVKYIYSLVGKIQDLGLNHPRYKGDFSHKEISVEQRPLLILSSLCPCLYGGDGVQVLIFLLPKNGRYMLLLKLGYSLFFSFHVCLAFFCHLNETKGFNCLVG